MLMRNGEHTPGKIVRIIRKSPHEEILVSFDTFGTTECVSIKVWLQLEGAATTGPADAWRSSWVWRPRLPRRSTKPSRSVTPTAGCPVGWVAKNTLRGFAKVRTPSGIIHHDVAHYVKDGAAWASPASKPIVIGTACK